MNHRYRRALVLFRRDLRLTDHTALRQAARQSQTICPAFIFDERQVRPHAYFSRPAFRFLLDALRALETTIATRGGQLQVAIGDPARLLAQWLAQADFEAIFVHRDVTPFARERDAQLARIAARADTVWHESDDIFLCGTPEDVLTQQGAPYKQFTAFWRRARAHPPAAPHPAPPCHWWCERLPATTTAWAAHLRMAAPREGVPRKHAIDNLRQRTDLAPSSYAKHRDDLHVDPAFNLSAHLKFGTVSIREVAAAIRDTWGDDHPLLRQLYWRDFHNYIALHFPHVFGRAFKPRYERVQWRHDEGDFAAWCAGRTGVPIVDAGMRQLVLTGRMPNRARMLAASFLIKDLGIDWRWGERFFARHLEDYDPAVNNGNWQWVASTGCDAAPYFRIFNPWRQQRRFDPDADYIRRWVEELSALDAPQIHGLEHAATRPQGYPSPRVEHRTAVRQTKARYAAAHDAPTTLRGQ